VGEKHLRRLVRVVEAAPATSAAADLALRSLVNLARAPLPLAGRVAAPDALRAICAVVRAGGDSPAAERAQLSALKAAYELCKAREERRRPPPPAPLPPEPRTSRPESAARAC
jgi:hypothetical protein